MNDAHVDSLTPDDKQTANYRIQMMKVKGVAETMPYIETAIV
jgi:hypothetical protein